MSSDPDVAAYALRLGDDELILAQRLCGWATRAPEIEQDVALLNIALDHLGQASVLLSRAGQLEAPSEHGTTRDQDDLAFLRDGPEFTNALIMELDGGDFGCTMARQLLVSAYTVELWTALCQSTDEVVAGVAGKAIKEARYHLDHAHTWVVRLGDGTPTSYRRMQDGLDQIWPYAAELFETDALLDRLVARGVAADPAALQPGWLATVQEVLTDATLTVPETTWRPTGGRIGAHTEPFGVLLAEMQQLHRAHPGASW